MMPPYDGSDCESDEENPHREQTEDDAESAVAIKRDTKASVPGSALQVAKYVWPTDAISASAATVVRWMKLYMKINKELAARPGE